MGPGGEISPPNLLALPESSDLDLACSFLAGQSILVFKPLTHPPSEKNQGI